MEEKAISQKIDTMNSREEVLRLLLEEEGLQQSQNDLLLTRGKENKASALSFAQQRLWFLDQLEPGSTFYNTLSVYRFSGPLTTPLLESCLREIVRRHEILRTVFVMQEQGEVHQVVVPDFAIPLEQHNLSLYEQDEQEILLLQWADAELQNPFDLQQGPLLRTTLLQLSAHSYVLLVCMHHIITDGWSMEVFERELNVFFTAFSKGNLSLLPELPIQYKDFSSWQQQWLQGERQQRQIAYWQRQLANLPVLEFPTDYPRPAVQRYRGKRFYFDIPSLLTRQLKTLSHNANVTLFMTLLAAFQTLLFRYCHQQDIAVGSPIANRTQEELEPLIGFFVNTLVLRAHLSDHMTFHELLAQVQQISWDAYEHQDIPFEKLVEIVNPERSLSYTPLFQVLFALQTEVDLASTHVLQEQRSWKPDQNLRSENGTSRCDFSISLTEMTNGSLSGIIEYNTDLFEHSTIERFIQHFCIILGEIAKDPHQQLSAIPLLSPQELHQFLSTFNDTSMPFPNDRYVHELVEEQAQRWPDRVALVFENDHLTYKELNQRATLLAHALLAYSCKMDAPIGICADGSVELVVGLLAILKVGAAYVPIDPQYPKKRISFMLQDARISIVLTFSHLADLFTETAETEITCLYLDKPAPFSAHDTDLLLPIHGDQLAYIIYTSGSTGRPKGVQISHSNLLSLLSWHQYAFDIKETDRATQIASIAFDACVWEIWPYLVAGSSVHIANQETRHSADALYQWFIEREITITFLTPAFSEKMLDFPWQASSPLRLLLTGGDVLHHYPSPANPFVLVNAYGPTEATVVATAGKVTIEAERQQAPSIGRPISNTHVYILDATLNVVPLGVPGEIYISGKGLARGYRYDPALTALRFIPHPFSIEPGARLYRTGDRGRYLPNGIIEFLGRNDYQVKLRGYRIELGEIETLLSLHPQVREVAVVVREELGKQLVAYIVLKQPGTLKQDILRTYMQERLPAYMVPSTFEFLETLPLTPHGKLDYHALPIPLPKREEAVDEVITFTPVQEMLIAIWTEVLLVEHIGLHDNFFELGGHSLLVTQVLSRIRKIFHVELSMRVLFEAQTIMEQAHHIELAQLVDQPQLPTLISLPEKKEYPLSFAQQRLWFLNQLMPDTSFYSIPLALELQGPMHIEALEQCLNTIVMRHATLRTTFKLVQGNAVQIITPAFHLQLPIIDLRYLTSSYQQDAIHQITHDEVHYPFSLEDGPLVRTHLLYFGENQYILLLLLHHIVADAWSMSVLGQEIATLYSAYLLQKPSSLPDISVQYTDFVSWQQQVLQGSYQEQLFSYWKNQLKGTRTLLDLPTDYPRPPLQTFVGSHYNFVLARPLVDTLKKVSQQQGLTLFMTLLAAFQVLLYLSSGQQRFLVGTPVANRTQIGLEDLIGFFVNTLVLKADFSQITTFSSLFEQVRKVTLEAYVYQDLPFEKLVEELHPKRDLSRNPLFQVLFTLQNTPAIELRLEQLALTLLDIDPGISLFDLNLMMMEKDGELVNILSYNTDLFKMETVQEMVINYQYILERMVHDPHISLSDLSFPCYRERPFSREEGEGEILDDTDKAAVPKIAYAEPVTEVEQTLSILWQNLLNVSHVSRYDNFFDLGGHSLLVVQMHSQLQQLFEKSLTIVDLFTFPTIASLASHLTQEDTEGKKVALGKVYSRAEKRKETRHNRQIRKH